MFPLHLHGIHHILHDTCLPFLCCPNKFSHRLCVNESVRDFQIFSNVAKKMRNKISELGSVLLSHLTTDVQCAGWGCNSKHFRFPFLVPEFLTFTHKITVAIELNQETKTKF